MKAAYESGLTEREIASALGVPRARVGEALAALGMARRSSGRSCPVEPGELRRLVTEEGVTQAGLAQRFGVAPATAGRWLAEIGIGIPDPRIPWDRLHQLYVDDQLPVREVAAELDVPPGRVIRELAQIPRRARHNRRPTAATAAVTCAVLEDLYVQSGFSLRQLTVRLGVSDEYLRSRLRACGIAKRLGAFTTVADVRARLAAQARELYVEHRYPMTQVASQLGISATLVGMLLHEAGVPVRRPGPQSPRGGGGEERQVLRDLYHDPAIKAVLDRFGIPIQDSERWVRPSPFTTIAPDPLPDRLLFELYEQIGLTIFHISLLVGTGTLAVKGRLNQLGIPLRGSGPSPWTRRQSASQS